MTKKRLEYLDMARGIGTIGIVMAHSGAVPQWAPSLIISLTLPLFFLTSGMLLGCTGEWKRNGKEILRRKARSLLQPFLCFSLLYLLRDVWRVTNGSASPETLGLAGIYLVTFAGSSVLWFLPALFLSELLFIFLRKKWNTVLCCAATAILTTLSYLADNLLQVKNTIFLSDEPAGVPFYFLLTILRALYVLPYVCIGYVLFEKGENFWKTEKGCSGKELFGGVIFLAFGGALGMLNGFYDLRMMNPGRIPGLTYLSATLFFAGVLFIGKNSKPIKPLSYFGKNSLTVMVTHMDFYLLFCAHILAYKVNSYLPGLNQVFFFVNVMGAVLLLEVPCIFLINRYFPFLIGKRKDSHSRESLV